MAGGRREKAKATTLDPLLDWIHSLIGSPIRSGTSVEDDGRGEGEGGKRVGAGGAKRAGHIRCGPYN